MNERIIRFFLDHPGEYISGEELSEHLKCSRTAVWKHIQQLRRRGYRFESAPRKGYRLIGRQDAFGRDEIAAALAGCKLIRSIHFHETVDSTQAEAQRLVAAGAGEGTLVVAERQTAGRGRAGRFWHSPAGKGVWLSLVLKPPIALQFAPQMTLLTAAALCRAIRRECGIDAAIKWPNDLLWNGRKISGILAEASGENELVRHVIIGVGIDCNLEEHDFPEELRGRAASLKIASGRSVDRAALTGAFLREFEALYAAYLERGFEPIRALWETFAETLGKAVRIRSGGAVVEGTAEAVDERGALIVRRPDGSRVTVYSGETEG